VHNTIDSPIGKWLVEKCDDISSNSYKSHSLFVKKQLFVDDIKGKKSVIEYTN